MDIVSSIVPSPCKRVCTVIGDHCAACGRTLDEISAWRLMTDKEKKAVWQRIEDKDTNDIKHDEK